MFSVEHIIFSIFYYENFQTQKRKILSKYTYTYHLGSIINTLLNYLSIYISINPSNPPLIHASVHLVP